MATYNQKIDHAEARRLRADGLTLQAIADRYGATRAAVSIACRGVVCPTRHPHAPFPTEVVAVPAWAMAAGLAEEYRDLAASVDEHHAARECRRLKAEAQRPCA